MKYSILLALFAIVGNCCVALSEEGNQNPVAPLIPRDCRMEFKAGLISSKPVQIRLLNRINKNEFKLMVWFKGIATTIEYVEVGVTARSTSGNPQKVDPWITNGKYRYIEGEGQWGAYTVVIDPKEALASITVKWKGEEQTLLISEGRIAEPLSRWK